MYDLTARGPRDPGPGAHASPTSSSRSRRRPRRTAASCPPRWTKRTGAGPTSSGCTPPTCPRSSAAAAARCSNRSSSRSRAAGPPTPWAGSLATPPAWLPAVATPDQIEHYVLPAHPGREGGVLRHHRGRRRLRRRRHRGHRPSRRRRATCSTGSSGTSPRYNSSRLRLLPGQADRGRPRRRARHVHRRPALRRGAGGAHAGVHPHHQPPPPDRGVRVGPRAGRPAGRGRRATAWASPTSGSATSA